MQTIYLCGPINGQNDSQCRVWRERVKDELAGRFLFRDPMDRDYRGIEDGNVSEIVEGDKADILASDILLVNADIGASWGTAMEVMFAYSKGKRIIAFHWRERVSPWLRYHAEVVPSLTEAIERLTHAEGVTKAPHGDCP